MLGFFQEWYLTFMLISQQVSLPTIVTFLLFCLGTGFGFALFPTSIAFIVEVIILIIREFKKGRKHL